MVSTASFHLEGDGQHWFFKLAKRHANLTWAEFEGPPIREGMLEELSKLQQTGSVEDYIQRFEELSAQVESVTSNQ